MFRFAHRSRTGRSWLRSDQDDIETVGHKFSSYAHQCSADGWLGFCWVHEQHPRRLGANLARQERQHQRSGDAANDRMRSIHGLFRIACAAAA